MMRLACGLCLVLVLLSQTLGAYGTPVGRWTVQPVVWRLNPTNDKGYTADDVEAVAQRAAAAWNNLPGVAFQFVYAGRTTSSGGWGDNVVMFSAEYSYDYAGTWQSFYAGEVFGGTIVVYTSRYNYYLGSTGCNFGGAYLEDILVHEFGHMAGLTHSTVSGATMYPGYAPCSTTQRTLEADDIAAMTYLYPDANFNWAPTVGITAPTTGTVIAPGTPVTLSGVSSDREDGDLTSEILWSSSVAGYLGYGATIQTALPLGVQTITARVVDSGGAIGTAVITVTVAMPVLTMITAPLDGSKVAHNHDVTIKATATSSSGSVQRVEFFVNNGLICTDAMVPYACKWRVPMSIGTTYTLRAVAYDAIGSVGWSADLNVTSK